eukprot:3560453-Amphidinium_carterae.1
MHISKGEWGLQCKICHAVGTNSALARGQVTGQSSSLQLQTFLLHERSSAHLVACDKILPESLLSAPENNVFKTVLHGRWEGKTFRCLA